MANLPIATQTLAAIYGLNGNRLQRQYRNHFSDYQKFKEEHQNKDYLLFAHNLTETLSIDETALSNGELYTIVTLKAAREERAPFWLWSEVRWLTRSVKYWNKYQRK
ncbi:MAG TPA: hypothetical protein VL093_14265 [Flavipsychrobacter sp.]|nr:hypothetical protein [Flavipsychrobacter sp.]